MDALTWARVSIGVSASDDCKVRTDSLQIEAAMNDLERTHGDRLELEIRFVVELTRNRGQAQM